MTEEYTCDGQCVDDKSNAICMYAVIIKDYQGNIIGIQCSRKNW